jgi:hypothetical protein
LFAELTLGQPWASESNRFAVSTYRPLARGGHIDRPQTTVVSNLHRRETPNALARGGDTDSSYHTSRFV